ncbi:carotenoid ester lipase [Moniliophthora roreri]|nr:carotenoid ester lipase [Moniliophthora roreri]
MLQVCTAKITRNSESQMEDIRVIGPLRHYGGARPPNLTPPGNSIFVSVHQGQNCSELGYQIHSRSTISLLPPETYEKPRKSFTRLLQATGCFAGFKTPKRKQRDDWSYSQFPVVETGQITMLRLPGAEILYIFRISQGLR